MRRALPTALLCAAALFATHPTSLRASCLSASAFHPPHCYGAVTSRCVAHGTYTYSFQMSAGYKCAGLFVTGATGQTLVGTGSASQPSGWSVEICDGNSVAWTVLPSAAAASAGTFKVTFSDCDPAQFVGFHVVPILSQNPYIPSNVAGPTYTFYAYASAPGCTLTGVKASTWGSIHRIYR